MLCRNCNYILSGEEDFCPHCGTACKIQDVKENSKKDFEIKIDDKEPEKSSSGSSIFQSEPIYVYSDVSDGKSKSKTSKTFLSLMTVFLVVLLIIGAVTLAEYFDIGPAISGFLTSRDDTTTTAADDALTTAQGEFNSSIGLVPPDVNYKPVVCLVLSQKGLPLRKGPDDFYAQIEIVPYATQLQVIGGCLNNNEWVYVYIPADDIYGWLSGSYLSEASALDKAVFAESRTTTTESTAQSTTEKKEDKASDVEFSEKSYTAKVLAEKGLYLRKGPGVSYEAILVIGQDEEVTVLGNCKSDSSWLYVSCKGEKGFMNKAYLGEV